MSEVEDANLEGITFCSPVVGGSDVTLRMFVPNAANLGVLVT